MNLPLTISSESFEHPAMDYAFLREQGIRLLEKLGGGHWTDFNTHDPGITILEQVCYALTDLAYRIDYDIKDLLASNGGDLYESLYSPAEILAINPVTLTDIRKLVIDVPGVKNAWIERVDEPAPALEYDPSDAGIYLHLSTSRYDQREPLALRGLYRVQIEKDAGSNLDSNAVLRNVNSRLQACRLLGEDFIYPKDTVPSQGILVNARIEIGLVEDPELLLAKICLALAEFISPHIKFYTLEEMLKKGKSMDEAMSGPVLQHGFIDDAELERFDRRISIRTSDLIQEILDVEGAVAVNKIQIKSGNICDNWYLEVKDGFAPFFDVESSLPKVQLVRDGVGVNTNPERVLERIKKMRPSAHTEPLPESQRDMRLPPGRDREVSHYDSIQHQFPATYGIGALGLPESASPQRKAQAKQLKAYLMFFDQILANYFAQLGNLKELFSFYSPTSPTHFSQVVEDEELGLAEIRANDREAHAANLQKDTEDPQTALERKNRFLNHLLARFAEGFTGYSLLQDASLNEADLIDDKQLFLQEYRDIGHLRGTGFDYTRPAREQENRSGLERRICRKLGIPVKLTSLADMDGTSKGEFHLLEHIYLLEHILLRPRDADREQYYQTSNAADWQVGALLAQVQRSDPYSHQISFILPDWIELFKDTGFFNLISKTLREETPAHLRVYIHWLDQEKMLAFESARRDWLESVIAGRLWKVASDNERADPSYRLTHIKIRDARDRMIEVLGIGLPYPLRDLRLIYDSMVAFDQSTKIQIEGGQIGVLYQLCDEDGNPIVDFESGERIEVEPQAEDVDNGVFLPTPKITRDITFRILAIREGGVPLTRLEVYLNQVVSIRSGIDSSLHVAFLSDTDQIATENELITNYGRRVTVQICNSQEGVSYKLITGSIEDRTDLSAPQKGNRGTVSLTSTETFTEDMQINVLAYRTSNWHLSDILDTNLFIKVRPNPSIEINLESTIIDYGAESVITLPEPQPTSTYELYKRELVPDEYLSDGTAESIQIHTDEGRDVFIKPPQKITDWDTANGFLLLGAITDNNGVFSISTGSLPEDTLFIVRATKIDNGETLQLDQAVAVLVRPDTEATVSVLQEAVEANTNGVVTVSGTQKGVAYQLRLEADDTPVNQPGYDLADRGIETTRLEVDFIVEEQGDPILLLPTGPITGTTTFNILAFKILTGVSAELTGKANIGVSS